MSVLVEEMEVMGQGVILDQEREDITQPHPQVEVVAVVILLYVIPIFIVIYVALLLGAVVVELVYLVKDQVEVLVHLMREIAIPLVHPVAVVDLVEQVEAHQA